MSNPTPHLSPAVQTADDASARRLALNPTRSFVVRAPAGSGKTELLIQRYLALLGQVNRPEAIVAITFTKKAAGEMRERIVTSLRAAEDNARVKHAFEEVTRGLALQALERDRAQKWNLLEHPGRLRVQTMDSLWVSIAGEMPWLSRLGEMPRIQEDASLLYELAARRTLLESSGQADDELEIFLRHLDNNAALAQQLIAVMLAKRDQWIELTFHSDDEDRQLLEEALCVTIESQLALANELIPESAHETWLALARFTGKEVDAWPGGATADRAAWGKLVDVVLTKDDWRKRGGLNKTIGFPRGSDKEKDACMRLIAQLQEHEGLLETLKAVRNLPAGHYTQEQWDVLRAMLLVLRQAAAQLLIVFRERGEIDFCELSMSASRALGDFNQPTDLAYKLDARIEHLLVDEFQDTSRTQFELVKKLTADWLPSDFRTLFLVGDPMQSIYRFRQAEVGLFMQAEKNGVGQVRLEPLQLTVNYRSVAAIVESVNHLCSGAFPAHDEMETGAVAYHRSQALETSQASQATKAAPQLELFEEPAVTWDIFAEEAKQNVAAEQEAACVVRRVQEAPAGSVAILVQARTHLPQIVSALKAAGLAYSAIDVDPLDDRPTARDLLSLTMAMLHRADRIAWLAILRAPWCGLELPDLHALLAGDSRRTVWEGLQDLHALSEHGQVRALRCREVLSQAFAAQGRWPLRRWVERTWMQLGGPAVLAEAGEQQQADALSDAAAFFRLLEQEQDGLGLRDLEQFRRRVALLFGQSAAPQNQARQLHVMTIHKAKGLQFDTVIVPGLGRSTRKDDPPLVLFHEWTPADDPEGKTLRLMAPISEIAKSEDDPLYRYLKSLETRKAEHERKRQFYVAATRARTRLHLLGAVKRDQKGAVKPPSSHSMLGDVWPALSDIDRQIQNTGERPQPQDRHYAPKRLPLSWQLPELAAPVAVPPQEPEQPHEPSFEWVSDRLRLTGTVVHAFLQRMASSLALPDNAQVRGALRHSGVSPRDLDSAAKRVMLALRRTLESERGRWILGAHAHLRTEYALTAVDSPGEETALLRGLIDRTFVDENGVRWVIDFKTSTHEGAGLEQFLDEEQRRYHDQMERYARILQPLGQRVRLGLYFPLLDEWREWSAF